MDTIAFLNVLAKQKNGNVVIAPTSIIMLLCMLARGASGVTRKELAKLFRDMPEESLDTVVTNLVKWRGRMKQIVGDDVKLESACAMWINQVKASGMNKTFLTDMEQEFHAAVSADKPFTDHAAVVDDINNWAAVATKGCVQNVMTTDELDPYSTAVLLNAFQFKGTWARSFDKALTHDAPFHDDVWIATSQPGDPAPNVQMMSRYFGKGDDLLYLRTNAFVAVSLPYGSTQDQGGNARMMLVRPTDDKQTVRDWLAADFQKKNEEANDDFGSDDDDETFEKKENDRASGVWLHQERYKHAVGTVKLPRMHIQQRHDLGPALQEMGFQSAFSDAADFSRMTTSGFRIDTIFQDVHFTTDEDGTTAAAVTRTATKGRSDPEVSVAFNRSFFAAVIVADTLVCVAIIEKP